MTRDLSLTKITSNVHVYMPFMYADLKNNYFLTFQPSETGTLSVTLSM